MNTHTHRRRGGGGAFAPPGFSKKNKNKIN